MTIMKGDFLKIELEIVKKILLMGNSIPYVLHVAISPTHVGGMTQL